MDNRTGHTNTWYYIGSDGVEREIEWCFQGPFDLALAIALDRWVAAQDVRE